jgi:predicted Rossmann fold nucleotide-binding protein DprA/Smf involved in DNA uptake
MFSMPTILTPKNANYPSMLKGAKEENLFPRIWSIGNLDILKRPLLGFFCSVKCPGDLILRTYDLARDLRDTGVPVISGFHSPIEKDCFDLLLKGSQPIIFCPARGIQNMRFGKTLKENTEMGRALVLSPFEGKVRRPTAPISERRNQFIGALAAAVFVSYAEAAGKTEEFCRGILQSGKRVYTFESLHNRPIIDMGAKLVTTKTITQWTFSQTRGDCWANDKG